MNNPTKTAVIDAGIIALAYTVAKQTTNPLVIGLIGIVGGIAIPIINDARTGHCFRIWK